MVELKKLSFENIHDVLKLRVNELQKKYVEEVSFTIALAQEPGVLQQFSEVYRLIGFLIDLKYQNMGFGRYKSFTFYDTWVRYEDDCVFVRLPN